MTVNLKSFLVVAGIGAGSAYCVGWLIDPAWAVFCAVGGAVGGLTVSMVGYLVLQASGGDTG